jgi:hypothetical protein
VLWIRICIFWLSWIRIRIWNVYPDQVRTKDFMISFLIYCRTLLEGPYFAPSIFFKTLYGTGTLVFGFGHRFGNVPYSVTGTGTVYGQLTGLAILTR